MAPLISIAIPTRERGRYLTYCLETTLRCDLRKVEIVVSDNASADASFVDDPRFAAVKFVRQPSRIPIAANYEAVFAACSGDYILYLGDDDAVMPSGIADLAEILEARRPDIVSWPEPQYFWPLGRQRGSLTIKRRHMRGGFINQDPREIMRLVCDGLRGNSAVHCGCLKRSIVENIRARCGRYFYHVNPDAAAYGALSLAQTYFYLSRPVTMYGRSPASHTTALASHNSVEQIRWRDENAKEIKPHNLDIQSRAVAADALDGLLTTFQLLDLKEPPIDVASWKRRIAAEVARMPEAERPWQLDLVNVWLGKIGQSPIALPAASGAVAVAQAGRRRPSLSKVELAATPTFLANAAEAADFVEFLVGPGTLVRREPWLAASVRWARLLLRAKLRSGRGMQARREGAAS